MPLTVLSVGYSLAPVGPDAAGGAEQILSALDHALAAIGDFCDLRCPYFVGHAQGTAILVETATDNVTRTVANVRMHFKNNGGNMGNTGSVGFMFTKMGVFRLNPEMKTSPIHPASRTNPIRRVAHWPPFT